MNTEQIEALAKVLGDHYWDMTDEIRVDGVWTWVACCECGDMPPMVDGHKHIVEAMLASDAFRALVAGERAAALREAAEADRCGGCKGEGSHRRHCPRHPNYHPWIPLADRAESVGDSIGVPALANRAWSLAGAIREAIPDHPYRPALRAAKIRTTETEGTK